MTNPIPAWWPKQKTINWCMGGNWSKEEQVGRNQAIEDCLTAFKENMLTVEDIEKVIYDYRGKIDDDAKGIYIGEDSGEWEEKHDKELAILVYTRLMEGK